RDDAEHVRAVGLGRQAEQSEELEDLQPATHREGCFVARTALAGGVDANPQTAFRLRAIPAPLGLGDRVNGKDLAVLLLGEATFHAHDVERRVLAPHLFLLLDPLARREPIMNVAPLDEVGRLLGAHRDASVVLRTVAMRAVELALGPSSVPEEQHAHATIAARARASAVAF